MRWTRYWIACDVACDVGVHRVSTHIVAPVPAAAGPPPSLAAFAQGLAIHSICLGLTLAYIARRFDGARHY